MLYFVFIVYPLEIFISLVDCAVIQLMAQPLYHPKGFQYIKTYFGTIFMWKSSQISGFCSHVLRLFPYHVVCNMNMYRDDSFLPLWKWSFPWYIKLSYSLYITNKGVSSNIVTLAVHFIYKIYKNPHILLFYGGFLSEYPLWWRHHDVSLHGFQDNYI